MRNVDLKDLYEGIYKGKHGQSEKEYQDDRSDAGKMISGDSTHSGAAYSARGVKNTGPNPAGGKEKPKAQGHMGKKDRDYLAHRKAMMKKEEIEMEEGYGAPGHNPGSGEKSVARAKALMDKQGRKGAPGLDAMAAAKKEHEARRGVKKEEVEISEEEKKGKKDACYHKVKSRYSVWPSAYASGALVKCRQKGAKNWGSKKEDMEMAFAYLMNEGFCDTEHGAINMLDSMSDEWLESIIEQLEEME